MLWSFWLCPETLRPCKSARVGVEFGRLMMDLRSVSARTFARYARRLV